MLLCGTTLSNAQGLGADSLRLGSAAGGSSWISLPSSASGSYRLILPSTLGVATPQLMHVNGLTGQIGLLSPGAASELLQMSGSGMAWINPDTLISTTAWSLHGNAGTTAGMFIGTTDAHDLRFFTNNTERLRILSGGNIGIGQSAPSQLLHISGGNIFLDTASSGTAGQLRFSNPAGSFFTALRAGAQSQNLTYTWPTTAPAAGQYLVSDASGNLSWQNNGSVSSGTTNNSTLRWSGSAWVENTNVQTSAGTVTVGSNSNAASLVLNDGQATSKTATIGLSTLGANRVYTIPEAGANANFVMTEGAQTINGSKTFGSAPTVSPFSTAGVVKNNASGLLSSGTVSLASTNDVSGILPVANGGTGVATITGFPSGNGTAAMTARTMTGTANQISVTNGDGTAGNPTFALASDPIIPGNASLTIPIGTSGQQPGSPVNGMMRYNSTSNRFEFYQNGSWVTYATGGASIAAGTVTNSTLRWNGTAWVENTNAQTNAGALTLGSNSNAASVVLNDGQATSKTATISLANLAANRAYTIPDAGTTASFVMTEGTQTINGSKTFGSAPTISPFSTAGVVKNNASGLLSSGTVSLSSANDVSGILPVANGGTGVATMTGFPSGNGTAAMTARTMTGTANQISVTNGDGTAGNPTFGLASDPIVPGNASLTIPIGTTGQQPVSPVNGMIRYNSSTGKFEFYQSGAWTNYATGGASVASGTTTNSTLRWNGSAWVENTNAQTNAGALTLGSNSNAASVVLNDGQATSKTATISLANLAANRAYTIPDAGTTASFVMTEGAQTINGTKSFNTNVLLSNSGTASELRFFEPSAGGSNYTGFKAQSQSVDVTYTLPAADGSNGQVLSTNGSSTLSWVTPSTTATTVPISGLTAAAATNSINNADYAQTWQWNSLSSNTALALSSTSTAAASNTQKLLSLSLSGANATTTQTTYGLYSTNTHTGTSSTNIAAYLSASGGTNNYALVIPSGNVGIGTTTPTSVLHVNGASRFSGGNLTIDTSASGTAGSLLFYNPARTFTTSIKAGAQGANLSYTWPTSAPSAGQFLQSDASGNMSWQSASTSTAISALTAATATNSINNVDYAQTWQWNSLSSNSALTLSSTSTAAASNGQKMLNISLSGANSTTTQSTYGLYLTNTHTGTSSTNVGAYISASGGTNNYALLIPSGNVGIGTSTPTATLHVNGSERLSGGNLSIDTSASGTAGQLQFYNPARTFTTSFKAGANTGNVTYTLPTADGSSGQMLSTNGSGTLSWASAGATITYGVNSPGAYGADQTDLSLTLSGNSVFRVSASTTININSIASGTDGRQITLINVGSNAITIKHQSATGTAANKMILSKNADAVMNADDMITLIYDGTTGRWREMNRNF